MEEYTPPNLRTDSTSWVAFVKISFVLAVGATCTGIALIPADFWVRGYLLMGLLFTVGATFSLAKTMRDQHEARLLLNRLEEAKTTKMLKEYAA